MKRKVIYTLLWVGVMVLIFWFSNQNGEESATDSGFIVDILNAIGITKIFPGIADSLEFIVRKCAHFFIYTCLGLTGVLALRSYLSGRLGDKLLPEIVPEQRTLLKSFWGRHIIWIRGRVPCIVAFLWGFLYACSDEWHQTFISGRAGSFRDVLIDTTGVLMGVFVMWLRDIVKNDEKRYKRKL